MIKISNINRHLHLTSTVIHQNANRFPRPGCHRVTEPVCILQDPTYVKIALEVQDLQTKVLYMSPDVCTKLSDITEPQ